VDDIIGRLDVELAPPPPPSDAHGGSPPPPPTFFEGKTGPIRSSHEVKFGQAEQAPAVDFDVTSVKFEPDDSTASSRVSFEPIPMSRDISLTASKPKPAGPAPAVDAAQDSVTTRAFRIDEVLDQPAQALPGADSATETPISGEPSGRVLADLYFAQGHYTEALRIYDDLVAATPFDTELKRMRREAEARLLPASTTPAAAGSDSALERRLGKIRALKRWLSVVQTG
jgi:hypothetical protein